MVLLQISPEILRMSSNHKMLGSITRVVQVVSYIVVNRTKYMIQLENTGETHVKLHKNRDLKYE